MAVNASLTTTTARRHGAAPACRPYDFRRPNKFSREHVRALQIVNETFARQFSNVLASTLRAVSQVTLTSVEQLTYDEYIRSTEAPTYLAILSMDPLPGAGILHLPLSVAMAAVDRLLGGSGAGTYPNRPLTDIESGLVRGLTQRVLRELSYAFESLVTIDAQLVMQESNPQFAQIAAPTEMVVVATSTCASATRPARRRCACPSRRCRACSRASSARRSSAATAPERAQRRASAADRAPAGRPPSTSASPSTPSACRPATSSACAPVTSSRSTTAWMRPLTVAVAGVPCHAAVAGRKGKRLACLVVDPTPRTPMTTRP